MKQAHVRMTYLSNIFEWYDFGLSLFLAPTIGAHFFSPQFSSAASTRQVLLIFAVGFICRPLGGILFGHYGDTRGRATVLRLSILMITLSTLLIGLLPSYQTIGFSATILFILLRLAQGISVGGEYSGVMIYLAESAPEKKRGFITSFAAVGANIGFLFATFSVVLLKNLFTDPVINNWAWRLPFIIMGLPGAIFFYYRLKLIETRVYIEFKAKRQVEKTPFVTAILYAPGQVFKIIGLTCMSASLYYMYFGYIPYYLSQYTGVPLKNMLSLQCFLLIAMLFLVPLGGICGDFFTRKKMMMFTTSSVILLSLPCFYLFQLHSSSAIILSLSIATLLSSLDQGNVVTAVVDNAPENVRYSTLAFAYNLGNALFGGTAPLITSLLIEKLGLLSPAYYLMVMAGLSLFATFFVLNNNESAGQIGEVRTESITNI